MDDRREKFGEPHIHSASELPWTDHEERGKFFVKVGDDFRWYLNDAGEVQIGAHWFNDLAAAQAAIEKYTTS